MFPNKSLEEITQIYGPKFDVCRWGSCQYSGAQAMYDTLNALCEENDDSDDMLNTLKLLGIEVYLGKSVDLKKVLNLEQMCKTWNMFDVEEDEEDEAYRTKFTKGFENVKFIDDYFIVCREMAQDLWTAVHKIFSEIFPSYMIICPKSTGHGFPLNVSTQSENFEVGIKCWILQLLGYVKNDECFQNFDT